MYVSMYMNTHKNEGRLYTSQDLFLGFFCVPYCDACVNIGELIFEVLRFQKVNTFFQMLWF